MRHRRPIRSGASALAEATRQNLTRATLSLFQYAPYPLESTLDYAGDPGVCGPGSISWHVLADPAAFVGGLRGLLIQSAHPEVVAGVVDHSRYQDDPFGRLSRTSAYVTATTFGAMPEVEQAVRRVERIHRTVKGVSSRGNAYDASDPGHSAWVHNVLTDSFLSAHQTYGRRRLTSLEADRFVAEQSRIGTLLGAWPLPETAPSLAAWVNGHEEVAVSPEMEEVVAFLIDPPVTPGIRVGYKMLLGAAIATIPHELREVLGLQTQRGASMVGRAAVSSLRWALGYSPSWALALRRVGADIPEDLFRRRPDVAV